MNVVVHEEDDGSITVGFMGPLTVPWLVEKPGVGVLAAVVRG